MAVLQVSKMKLKTQRPRKLIHKTPITNNPVIIHWLKKCERSDSLSPHIPIIYFLSKDNIVCFEIYWDMGGRGTGILLRRERQTPAKR
tara:strand:- start:335 stop:598 length:264 start_codon:yes stop_codon:yes gene_type:complete